MPRYIAPRGMEDILHGEIEYWNIIENKVRELFPRYGFKEVRTPMFEYTGLFIRSVGETTDIVQKEMYTFSAEQRDEDSLTLRPELTAPIIRAYIQSNVYKTSPFQKYFYIGPCFRKERPQRGRKRQFHQIGVETIGTYNPEADVETILLFCHLLKELKIEQYTIKINSIGCSVCKEDYKKELKNSVGAKITAYCQNCQSRFERNPLRVLDCKNEGCIRLSLTLPQILDFLCNRCNQHFAQVRNLLEGEGKGYVIEPKLVRGIDYYTKTIYEFTSPLLGAQDAICGGGRYDNLVKELGGPETGAVGFAAGIERMVLILKQARSIKPAAKCMDFYVIYVNEEQKGVCFSLLNKLRKMGLSGEMDFEGRSLKGQMRVANTLGVKFAVIIGKEEQEKNMVKLKRMSDGREQLVKFEQVGEAILHCSGG
jgi:histidyl-tRNA synthetase